MYAATAAGSSGHEFETQRGIPQLSQTQFSYIVIVKIVKNPNKKILKKKKYIEKRTECSLKRTERSFLCSFSKIWLG